MAEVAEEVTLSTSQLYTMEWEDIDLNKMIVAGSRFAGPIGERGSHTLTPYFPLPPLHKLCVNSTSPWLTHPCLLQGSGIERE